MEILQQYKNRDINIPKRVTKENVPDSSQRQDKKLSNMCHRDEMLLKEERITKIGYIAVGEWCSVEGSVEVIVEKGKFWHTMGFHKNERKWLKPFEALYLLETCSLDLRFHGVTMSMQEAYNVLIPRMLSMEFYQVYVYLMRLGYIIEEHRGFDTNVAREAAKERLCFKEVDSAPAKEAVVTNESVASEEPDRECLWADVEIADTTTIETTGSKEIFVPDSFFSDGSKEKQVVLNTNINIPSCQFSEPVKTAVLLDSDKIASSMVHCIKNKKLKRDSDNDIDRNLLPEKKVKGGIIHTSWNFQEICVPNVMEMMDCSTVPVRQSILDQILSPRTSFQSEKGEPFPVTAKKMMRSTQSFWNCELSTMNLDTETNLLISETSSPKNWSEYKYLEKQKKGLTPLHKSPMRHVWEDEVHPLIKPGDALTTSNLMCKLQIVKKANFAPNLTESCAAVDDTIIHFNVYLPELNYKKTAPGKPVIYVIATKIDSEPPSLSTVIRLQHQAGGIPVVWAVVDNADISWYSLQKT